MLLAGSAGVLVKKSWPLKTCGKSLSRFTPVNSEIVGGDGRYVDKAVVNVDKAETEIVHQRRREEMRFADSEEPALQRQVVRKVEIGRGDAAGEGAPEGSLEAAGAEGKQRFRIGEEEAGGEFVLAATEFVVPVGGELVVGVFSRLAPDKRACIDDRRGGAWIAGHAGHPQNRGEQEAVGVTAKLIALEIKQFENDRVNDCPRIAREKRGEQGSV